jgi:hypothetical protein
MLNIFRLMLEVMYNEFYKRSANSKGRNKKEKKFL